uniref:Uncharacterized protein n=1 Tax=Arundo donax TaxID=35708 RepID=A0A0A9FIH6_ARUDO
MACSMVEQAALSSEQQQQFAWLNKYDQVTVPDQVFGRAVGAQAVKIASYRRYLYYYIQLRKPYSKINHYCVKLSVFIKGLLVCIRSPRHDSHTGETLIYYVSISVYMSISVASPSNKRK